MNMIMLFPAYLALLKVVLMKTTRFSKLLHTMYQEENRLYSMETEKVHEIYLQNVTYARKSALFIETMEGVVATFVIPAIGIFSLIKDQPEKLKVIYANFLFDQEKHYGYFLIIQGVLSYTGAIYFSLFQNVYISLLTFVKALLQILQYKVNSSLTKVTTARDLRVVKEFIPQHQFIIGHPSEISQRTHAN
ncbi:hypothetical protein ABEB36_001579 [Hypothenemus hampei]|uniref:ABC transmembrane type-1 domain-containing protein n=1 Tax=Hypothenemus hampei TaxID=57062 RepID=A0ABD1FF40_HYPHA